MNKKPLSVGTGFLWDRIVNRAGSNCWGLVGAFGLRQTERGMWLWLPWHTVERIIIVYWGFNWLQPRTWADQKHMFQCDCVWRPIKTEHCLAAEHPAPACVPNGTICSIKCTTLDQIWSVAIWDGEPSVTEPHRVITARFNGLGFFTWLMQYITNTWVWFSWLTWLSSNVLSSIGMRGEGLPN